MNTQSGSTPSRSAGGRLAGFALGILLLTGCQAGWGATSEKSTPDTSSATAPAAREAAAPDPG